MILCIKLLYAVAAGSISTQAVFSLKYLVTIKDFSQHGSVLAEKEEKDLYLMQCLERDTKAKNNLFFLCYSSLQLHFIL